ncbi:MAG: hypothetical protein LUC93_16975 [Planctomycetaceae bacterium]|nr:hypothetical protein [Planctomycetaceae bacterium]
MEAAMAMENERRSIREWVVRLALMLVGLTVAHLGVTLFILPALGSDPFTIFVQGWAWQSGLSVGTCHVIILCLLMGIMLLTTKGYVLPGTIVCSFCGGPIIDLFTWLLSGAITPSSPMAVRIASMLAGCAVLAGGMALVIKSDAGTGANDLVAVILTDKLGRFQFRWVRVCCDIFFAATGFLLGGVLGFGSLAAALLVGPIAQFFFPHAGKVVTAAVARFCPAAG